MPTLDVSDVLASPEFQDTFLVISSGRTINANGVAVDNAATSVQGFGVVVPNPDSLIRQSDGSRLSGSIDIWTRLRLTGGYKIDDTSSQNADVILWNGRNYVVSASSDFTNFGNGFIHSNATLIDLNQTGVGVSNSYGE